MVVLAASAIDGDWVRRPNSLAPFLRQRKSLGKGEILLGDGDSGVRFAGIEIFAGILLGAKRIILAKVKIDDGGNPIGLKQRAASQQGDLVVEGGEFGVLNEILIFINLAQVGYFRFKRLGISERYASRKMTNHP